jgi:hypothetical protein
MAECQPGGLEETLNQSITKRLRNDGIFNYMSV